MGNRDAIIMSRGHISFWTGNIMTSTGYGFIKVSGGGDDSDDPLFDNTGLADREKVEIRKWKTVPIGTPVTFDIVLDATFNKQRAINVRLDPSRQPISIDE